MAFGWEGEKVRLVPLDRERHLDNALKWFNDPEVTRWTAMGDWPLTRLAEEKFFELADSDQRQNLHFAVESLQGEHIGFSGLGDIDWQSRVGVTGTVIGRTDLWDQGLGADAAGVRARYAFEVLNLRMLIGEVMADNASSLKMLAKAGYEEVARIPERYWKRGEYRDQVILALRRGD
jgi:RimJ/RimL family protein N-acetyltransferase